MNTILRSWRTGRHRAEERCNTIMKFGYVAFLGDNFSLTCAEAIDRMKYDIFAVVDEKKEWKINGLSATKEDKCF